MRAGFGSSVYVCVCVAYRTVTRRIGSGRGQLPSSQRLEAFSDGVVAIAITCLVLDLGAPVGRGTSLTDLIAQWTSYLAYLAAFLVIGAVWLTHHALFSRVRRSSNRLMLRNLLLLLPTCVVPCGTAVLSSTFRVGNRADQFTGVIFFAIISLMHSLVWMALTRYVSNAPQPLHFPADRGDIRRELRTQPSALVPPIIAMGLAVVDPLWGLIALALSPVYNLVVVRR